MGLRERGQPSQCWAPRLTDSSLQLAAVNVVPALGPWVQLHASVVAVSVAQCAPHAGQMTSHCWKYSGAPGGAPPDPWLHSRPPGRRVAKAAGRRVCTSGVAVACDCRPRRGQKLATVRRFCWTGFSRAALRSSLVAWICSVASAVRPAAARSSRFRFATRSQAGSRGRVAMRTPRFSGV